MMPRAVDPESAQGAVRLFKAGNQIPIPINMAVQGNGIKLYTKNLSPASYKVSVGRLLDIVGQPLTEPTATSFIIGSFNTFPDSSRVLAIGDISTTRLCPGEQAPDGTTYIEIVKAEEVETGKLVKLAFDAEGNQVDDRALLAEMAARRFAKFGYLDETLFEQLQATPDDDVIDIAVWPKIKHVAFEKDRTRKEPSPEQIEQLNDIERQKAKIVEILNHLGATVGREYESSMIPFVTASLRAVDIYKLAKSGYVGLVIQDSESDVVLDVDSD